VKIDSPARKPTAASVIAWIEHHCSNVNGNPIRLTERQKRAVRMVYDDPAGILPQCLALANRAVHSEAA
jgi:hypothetical protein